MSEHHPSLTGLITLAEARGQIPRLRQGKKISFNTIRRWITQGKLPGARKAGGVWLVPEGEFLALFGPKPAYHPPISEADAVRRGEAAMAQLRAMGVIRDRQDGQRPRGRPPTGRATTS